MVFAEAMVLAVSLIMLAKSSEFVVNGASKLSDFFCISRLAIGFLLISVSTSLPELSVSVISSSSGNGAIAAGNVFGSNIANILLVLGLAGFLYGFKIGQKDLKDIALALVATTIISAYIIFASSIGGKALGLSEGIALLLAFGYYLYYILKKKRIEGRVEKVGKKDALRAFLFFFGGVIVVLFSSGVVVESAVKIAKELGLAESFIGATIVAVGTSLPELTIDIQAIRKKQYGIALGDAIGSNMVNITLVLGAAAVINPIGVALPIFMAALLFAIIANILLLYKASVDRKFERPSGAFFLAVYAIYLFIIFFLQTSRIL